MAVERKYERDIDILLAEEFTVSSGFAAWFWRHTRFAETDAKVSDVFVSRRDSTGESDLIILYESLQGSKRFALMIEDKIDRHFNRNRWLDIALGDKHRLPKALLTILR